MKVYDSLDYRNHRIIIIVDELDQKISFVIGHEDLGFLSVADAKRYIYHGFDCDYCVHEPVDACSGHALEMAEHAKKVYNPHGNLPEFSYNAKYDCG